MEKLKELKEEREFLKVKLENTESAEDQLILSEMLENNSYKLDKYFEGC